MDKLFPGGCIIYQGGRRIRSIRMSGSINPRKQFIVRGTFKFEIHGRVIPGSVDKALSLLYPKPAKNPDEAKLDQTPASPPEKKQSQEQPDQKQPKPVKRPCLRTPRRPSASVNNTLDPPEKPTEGLPSPPTRPPPENPAPRLPKKSPRISVVGAKSEVYTVVSDNEADETTVISAKTLWDALDDVLSAVKPHLIQIMQGGDPQLHAAALSNSVMDAIHEQKMKHFDQDVRFKYKNTATIPQQILRQVLKNLDGAPQDITSPITRKVFVMTDRDHFRRLLERAISDLNCTHVEITTTKETVTFAFIKKCAPFCEISEFCKLLACDLGIHISRKSQKQLEFSMDVAMNSYKGLDHSFHIKPGQYTADQDSQIQNALCEAGMRVADANPATADIIIGADVQFDPKRPAMLVVDVLKYFAATDSAR